MTERSFNLVVPLAHEATDMRTTDTAGSTPERSGAVSRLNTRPGDVDISQFFRSTAAGLTPAFRTAYIHARQQTTDDGLGGPVMVSGESRMVLPCGYFFALGTHLYGRTGRGGRKACRLLTPVRQPRPAPLTPLGGEVCGSFNRTEVSTMSNDTQVASARRTAAPLPFYSYDAAKNPLFIINENVPFEALLDNAGCFMKSVEECMLNAASVVDHPSAWGAFYMAQMANAIIESMTVALSKESE